jgi:peptidoglycan hydrolase FlgJ
MNINGVSQPAASGTASIMLSGDAQQRARLVDAAQQFEGMMLQEMLKPLRAGGDNDWSGDKATDDEPGGGSDTISSFGVEAVAKAISKSGGVGIARQIIQQVTAEHDRMVAKQNKT